MNTGHSTENDARAGLAARHDTDPARHTQDLTHSVENDAPAPRVFHAPDCMDAYMLPCRCGADDANAARVIPPGPPAPEHVHTPAVLTDADLAERDRRVAAEGAEEGESRVERHADDCAKAADFAARCTCEETP